LCPKPQTLNLKHVTCDTTTGLTGATSATDEAGVAGVAAILRHSTHYLFGLRFDASLASDLPMASCVILTGVLPLLIFPSTRRGMTVGQRSAFGGRKACPVAKERPVAEVAYATGCTACRIRHWRASPQLRGDLLRDAPLPLLNQSFSPLTPTPPCVPRPETDAVSCACAGLAGRGCVQSGSMEHMY
jgi:hypothetical protein